nr:uncharacterized protein LOC124816834 [Hydra vulgaris]
MMNWSIEEVCLHLEQKGLGDLKEKIVEEEFDKKILLSLTETMVLNLCVTMRKQVMLLEIIKNLQAPPAQVNLNVSDLGVLQSSASEACYTGARNILVGSIRATTSWPVRYQLPILPPAVVRALESKDCCF